jgi:putative oxidoreductase
MLEKGIGNRIPLGLLFLRIVYGIVFIGHGLQKSFGFFGGDGVSGTIAAFHDIGIPLATAMAWMISVGELGSGILFFIGYWVRETALFITFVMLGAIWFVHADNGLFMMNNGYEYNLVLLAGAVCLFLGGGGYASLDRVIGQKNKLAFVKDRSQIRLEPPHENTF